MLTQSQIIYGLAYGSLLSILIPIAVGLSTWHYQSKPLRFFVLGLVGYFSVFLFSMILRWLKITNTMSEYLSSANDIIFFSACFGLAVKSKVRRYIIFTIGSISLLSLLVGPLLLKYYSVDAASVSLESIAVSIIVYIYLDELIRTTQSVSLWHVPLFWIALAKLSVTVVGFPYSIFKDQLNKYNVALSLKILLFTYGLYILCNIVFAMGLWRSKKYPMK